MRLDEMITDSINRQVPTIADQRLLTTKEIAPILGFKPEYLVQLRHAGIGPNNNSKQIPYIKRGARVFYDINEVTEYFNHLDQHIGG